MNNLRKAALRRWSKKLKNDLSMIRNDREALLMKVALCGFLAGDGSVQIRKEKKEHRYFRYELFFFPDDDEMLHTYLRFVKEVYNLRPRVIIRDNVYQARLSQRFIIHDLINLCKFGVYKWSFPKSLLKTKKAKAIWLRAFYSAEGYVGNKVIKIQSVNLKSIRKVRRMLKEFGIKSNYCDYKSSNSKHSKVGMIFINQKRSRMIYFKEIGFWHKRKTKSLKESLGL